MLGQGGMSLLAQRSQWGSRADHCRLGGPRAPSHLRSGSHLPTSHAKKLSDKSAVCEAFPGAAKASCGQCPLDQTRGPRPRAFVRPQHRAPPSPIGLAALGPGEAPSLRSGQARGEWSPLPLNDLLLFDTVPSSPTTTRSTHGRTRMLRGRSRERRRVRLALRGRCQHPLMNSTGAATNRGGRPNLTLSLASSQSLFPFCNAPKSGEGPSWSVRYGVTGGKHWFRYRRPPDAWSEC